MTTAGSGPHLGRRPLLAATAHGGLAVAGVAVAHRAGLIDGSAGATQPILQLSARTAGVQSLEVALGDDLLRCVGPRQWRTAALPTSTHSMVALTWPEGSPQPTVEISSRHGAGWRPWQRLPALHDLPDLEGAEGNGRAGTDVVWIGPADGIRVRLLGARPRDLALVLLHPARTPILRRGVAQDRRTSDRLKPALLTRGDWDANPAWRNGRPRYNDTIEQVHVHHTANSNNYSADDVPGLIRGIYRYHTKSLGWSDIGYNFLVDRFGRTWVGRAGGPGRPVRGAHTLGFNATSSGVAVIGNYESARPTGGVLAAIAQVAAWKLAAYDRDPQGRIAVRSEGSDRYRVGARPRLPVIDGHRDTNATACPGRHLYAALPKVRDLATEYIASTTPVQIVAAPVVRGTPVVDRPLQVSPGRAEPRTARPRFQWLRGGARIAGATSATYVPTTADVQALLSVVVTWAAEGREPAERTARSSGPVRLAPTLDVEALSDASGIAVTVTVTATGASSAPTGTVVVSLSERRRSVSLTEGAARVLFGPPVEGEQQVLVTYSGDSVVGPGERQVPVVVTEARRR